LLTPRRLIADTPEILLAQCYWKSAISKQTIGAMLRGSRVQADAAEALSAIVRAKIVPNDAAGGGQQAPGNMPGPGSATSE
jgi:hypothetical protein